MKEIDPVGNLKLMDLSKEFELAHETTEKPKHHAPVVVEKAYDFLNIQRENLLSLLEQELIDKETAESILTGMYHQKIKVSKTRKFVKTGTFSGLN